MAAALAPGKLGEAWTSINSQAGAFQSIVSARTSRVQTFDVAKLVLQFEKATLDATVTFDTDGKIGGLVFRPHQEQQDSAVAPAPAAWQPPNYAKQASFTEKPLELTDQGYTLPGTLTLPNGPGPFPAVVLVHGSGPHDEDETIGPNKPFKDLAWGLASHGIAVYRYTKRIPARTARRRRRRSETHHRERRDHRRRLRGRRPRGQASPGLQSRASFPGRPQPRRISRAAHRHGQRDYRRHRADGRINTKPLEKVIVEQVQHLTHVGDGTPSSAAADAQKAAEQNREPCAEASMTKFRCSARRPTAPTGSICATTIR